MNHYETADGKIVVDVMKYDVAPLFPLPDGSPSTKETPAARLFRWTFDLAGTANTFQEEQLDDRAGEFPRFDERFCMSDYRHGWIVARQRSTEAGGEPQHDGLIALRPQDRQERGLAAPAPDDRFGEPVFVPRARGCGRGRRLGAERGLSRRREALSDLAVFEATDIAKGPIALAHLSSRVPAGFHGNWRRGYALRMTR